MGLNFKLILVVALVAWFAKGVVQRLVDWNVFRDAASFNDGACRLVQAAGAVGLEDGDEHGGVVIFSADDRRQWLGFGGGDRADRLKAAQNGNLFAYTAEEGLVPLRIVKRDATQLEHFHPHGISFRNGLLAVVNHAPTRDEIALFRVDVAARTATLIDVLAHATLMHHLNDVVIVSPTELLVSRWENTPSTTLVGMLEVLLKLPLMSVVQARKLNDGSGWAISNAIEQLVMPNGLQVHDGKLLVAHPTMNAITVWQRDGEQGRFEQVHTIATDSAVDNIHVTGKRAFVVSHFQNLKFIKHVTDPNTAAPTSVSEIVLTEPWHEKVLLRTTKINAGSVAVEAPNGDLLIGAVFDAGLLVCPPQ